MIVRTLDLSRLVVFDGYYASGPYERFERLVVDPVTLPFHGTNLAPEPVFGGGGLRLLSGTYSLLVDGVVQTKSTPVGARGSFTKPLLTPGWHQLDILCPPGESCPTWFVFVGSGPSTDMPVFDGSYGITHPIASNSASGPIAVQHWQMVPTSSAPTPRPLPARVHPPFATAVPPSQLYRRELVPVTQGDIHRSNTNKAGIVSTTNQQAYFWASFIGKYPLQSLLDGPRGVGTVMMATHLEPGGTKGGTWFCDPWRFGHINADGKIQTMIGYRHDSPPHWEDGTVPTLLGDWSALAVKGFHELWGMAWRKSTLALDMNAPPINGEQPHIVGPQAFFADSQNNRVLRATWSPTDRSVPPVMTLFASGKDAWDVVEAGDKVYVSWRQEHRIAEYDAAGTWLRDVVKGAALASVAPNRFVTRLALLATIQAEPCVAPEGLFVQDGWLYFGSYAMAQVKRVNLTTGVVEVVCAPTIDGNSHFVKVSVSDGTFGPRGTVFTSTWSNNYLGHPQAFTPDGKPWNWFNAGPFACGKGGRWDVLGYSTSCGAGLGRLVCGSSAEGITAYSLALATDAAKDEAKYVAGRAQWWAKGYALLHGELGFGPFGLPLPYGETPEMDYFLNWNLFASENATALPPPPPQPTGSSMFKSTTKIGTDQYAPAAGPAGAQYWQLLLHGSGGGNFIYGDSWTAVCDTTMGYPDNSAMNFHVRNLDTYQHLNPHIELEPVDIVQRPAGTMESFWFGYTFPETPKLAHAFTEARLDALYDWFLVQYPQASRSRVVLSGNSMGAWGSLSYGLRRPDKYAAAFVTLPRWRTTDLNDIAAGYNIQQPNVLMADGSGQTFAQRMDMVAYVADLANKLPFIAVGTGRNDYLCPWQQHMDAIAALRATKRAFVYSWNNGDHSSATAAATLAAIEATYDRSKFELGVGYPVLMNSSRDNPLTDLVGGINLGFKWRNVSADGATGEITNTLGATKADVLPSTNTNQAPVTVSIPAANVWVPYTCNGPLLLQPAITNFVATPGTVASGQSAVLSATLANAVSQTIDGLAWDGQPLTVTPVASHTYALVATGAAGTTPATATVTVTVTTPLTLDQRVTAIEGRLLAAGIP